MRSKSGCKEEFELWKGKHGKAYAGAQHKMRLETFCVSMKEIQTINAIPGGTWRAAPNPYRSSQRPIDDHFKPNMMTHPHAHATLLVALCTRMCTASLPRRTSIHTAAQLSTISKYIIATKCSSRCTLLSKGASTFLVTHLAPLF